MRMKQRNASQTAREFTKIISIEWNNMTEEFKEQYKQLAHKQNEIVTQGGTHSVLDNCSAELNVENCIQ